jgi:hypothetical protein
MPSLAQVQLSQGKALLGLLLLTALLAGCSTSSSDRQTVGSAQVAFVGLTNIGAFARSEGSDGSVVLTSPDVVMAFPWSELVVSWNVELPAGAGLKVEARAQYPGRATGFYTMGWWSEESSRHQRESVTGQRDEDGDVKTDTLMLKREARRAQVRLTLLAGEGGQSPKVKLVGLSFAGANQTGRRAKAIAAARGRVLDVPEKSQLAYEGGHHWCSPTCVSMVLEYWAEKLRRAELKQDVPAVAAAVYDRNWPGTGNWPFNTAFAGRFPGMRAFVTRLQDVTQIEAWIAAGVPPVASVAQDLLNGEIVEVSGGHLVVCLGFTAEGDVVINDPQAEPASAEKVRRTIPRERFAAAWERSRRTVYLIYPEAVGGVPVP